MPRIAPKLLLAAGALSLLCRFAGAQITDQASADAHLSGKSFYLRGFWAADKLEFKEDGTPAHDYPVDSFTTSGIDITSVQLRTGGLSLTGERVALKFRQGKPPERVTLTKSAKDPSPVVIRILIDGTRGEDYAAVLKKVFAADLEDLTPSLPAYWEGYARKNFATDASASEGSAPQVSCAAINEALAHLPEGGVAVKATGSAVSGPQAEHAYRIGGTVRPPAILHTAEPEFSEVARRLKFSGNSIVSMRVNENGDPDCLRVVRPAGMGLDEKALQAVAQYKFRPATKDGTPVRVQMDVDVNFQIF